MASKIKKTRKFKCPAGTELNEIATNARHDPNNAIKMGITNNKITDIRGYDAENKRRKEIKNVPMPEQDCFTTCCNMKTQEVIDYIDAHCPRPELCECWTQICDDVYMTHGHGRPGEKAEAEFEIYAEKLFKELTEKDE